MRYPSLEQEAPTQLTLYSSYTKLRDWRPFPNISEIIFNAANCFEVSSAEGKGGVGGKERRREGGEERKRGGKREGGEERKQEGRSKN